MLINVCIIDGDVLGATPQKYKYIISCLYVAESPEDITCLKLNSQNKFYGTFIELYIMGIIHK